MKIYVDEMPASCAECKFKGCLEYYTTGCRAVDEPFEMDEDENYLPKSSFCPLQSLADHDKQVRNELIDEIENEIDKIIEVGDYFDIETDQETDLLKRTDVEKILDQLRGG